MKEKLLLVLLIGFLLEGAYLYHTGNIPYLFNPEVKGVSLSSNAVYWGAYIKGSTYGTGHNDVPWDCTDVTATNCSTWDLFEQHAGKKISILHFGEAWHWTSQTGYAGIGDGYFQKFYSGNFQTIRNHGAIPLIDWSSADLRANPYETQSEYTLAKITSGTYDTYIHQWATDAKAWGKPFFLRFDWEMNGNWYPWSELKNTNTSGQYVAMWRHVHDIFTSVGATNVSWVWCPNISSTDTSVSIPIGNLYPGDAYVDWTCLDGYNKDSGYKTFEQVFKGKGASVPVTYLNDSYQIVTDLAPTKP
ncbi:MAG TPA: glycosyl hydrolase, partial [Candidatus Saccharimonadales bacterium]|nr:glycosyl hydrolase [Candidatus Saccharimonadales bacterium]